MLHKHFQKKLCKVHKISNSARWQAPASRLNENKKIGGRLSPTTLQERSIFSIYFRKPTAQQLKNKAVADGVLAYLRETGKKMQIKQMIKEIPCLASIPECTPQYAMAIVRPMKESGIITRTEEKGVAYFSATPTDED